MGQHQSASPHAEPSPINSLPNELLIEIFDFYLQESISRRDGREKYPWFNLSRVCKRWRAIVFALPPRFDVCLLLKPLGLENRTPIKTLMSTNPLIPIAIEYDELYETAKDMGRLRSALKRPGRIRRIDLTLPPYVFDKFFKYKATKCSFPALESLTLRTSGGQALDIPNTFLKETNLHMRLRSLKLDPISLTYTSRLLSSATALTDLSLTITGCCELLPLLSQLQGMYNLRHLELVITDGPRQLTEPKGSFSLAKLTSFIYCGHSTFLNFLMMAFDAPSLQDFGIRLDDLTRRTQPLVPHLPRFINGLAEYSHSVQVFLKWDHLVLFSRPHFDLFPRPHVDLLLLAPSEDVSHHSLRLRLRFPDLPGSFFENWMMEITSMFSATLSTTEELVVVNDSRDKEHIPWRTFLKQFPSVKEFRMQDINYHSVASALQPYHNLSVLPALERITLCLYATDSELDVFRPFVTARQKAGRQVQVASSGDRFIRMIDSGEQKPKLHPIPYRSESAWHLLNHIRSLHFAYGKVVIFDEIEVFLRCLKICQDVGVLLGALFVTNICRRSPR